MKSQFKVFWVKNEFEHQSEGSVSDERYHKMTYLRKVAVLKELSFYLAVSS